MELSDIRKSIDDIDKDILSLFLKRIKLSEEVAKSKKQTNKNVRDYAREQEIINNIISNSKGYEVYSKILFENIMSMSRTHQIKLINSNSDFHKNIQASFLPDDILFPTSGKIAVQGVLGAYSSQSAEKIFPHGNQYFYESFEDVFDAVSKKECDYGVIPIENSSNGSVKEVYKLMKKKKFSIIRSVKIDINHKLLSTKGSDLTKIKKVISHIQALEQCSEYLKTLDNVQIQNVANTALASKMVSEMKDDSVAAISSSLCAKLYNLQIIAKDISNSKNNYTRFICISNNLQIYDGANKICIMLSLPHETGSLADIISKFSNAGLNLTKIESSPILGKDFEFMFYFEMQGSLKNPYILNLFASLKQDLETFEILGNYLEV